jgi:recombination protein RecR
MTSLPASLTRLIQVLGKLPGIGPRSAERLALHLVQTDPAQVTQLAEVLLESRSKVTTCATCGALTETQPCLLCQDGRRDPLCLCVVEKAVDILLFEKSGSYRGLYHVLGGKLSPLNGVEPEDLRIRQLEERLKPLTSAEIILALPSDVEGEATSHYLARRLSSATVKVSRLAHGIPVGGGLEFADELTLSRALQGRQIITT